MSVDRGGMTALANSYLEQLEAREADIKQLRAALATVTAERARGNAEHEATKGRYRRCFDDLAAERAAHEQTRQALAAAEAKLATVTEVVEHTERMARLGSTAQAKINFLALGYERIRALLSHGDVIDLGTEPEACSEGESKLAGGTFDEAMAAGGEGLGHKVTVRLYLPDLREIGAVTEVPRPFRHWVYRSRKQPAKVVMLSWSKRKLLEEQVLLFAIGEYYFQVEIRDNYWVRWP